MSMLPVTKRRTVNRLTNDGFTMIEMLFAMVVFSLFAFLLPSMISIIPNDSKLLDERSQNIEYELFISQLNSELQGSSYINVSDGRLFLKYKGETIIFEQYSNNIRRLVDGKGHEIVLQQVDSVEFSEDGQAISIQVIDLYEQTYQSRLYSFLKSVDVV